MNKKGSVLMITLWILAILVIFALGLGHRATINLRLVKYQRDRLKATYLAKAGINRAIAELEKDAKINNYDALNETWSTGRDPQTDKPLFENIEIKEGTGETFTVKYLYDKDKNEYRCIVDEESKLNINKSTKDQLKQLFIHRGFEEDVEGLAETIFDWIDSDTEFGKVIFKNGLLKVPEELLIILEYFYQEEKRDDRYREKAQQIYNNIKDLITVWGDSVNINTVSEDVLTILANAVAEPQQENCISALVVDLINVREEEGKSNTDKIPFHNLEEITSTLTDPNCVALLTNLKTQGNLVFKSNYFRMESTGNIGPTNRQITKNITAIYDRGSKKIIYWHEN